MVRWHLYIESEPLCIINKPYYYTYTRNSNVKIKNNMSIGPTGKSLFSLTNPVRCSQVLHPEINLPSNL